MGSRLDSKLCQQENYYSEGGHLLSKLADWVDPDSNNWDEDLIKQTLWPIDVHVQRILVVPVSQHDMTNFVAWSYTKNGTLSVWSAYFVEWDHEHGSKVQHTSVMG